MHGHSLSPLNLTCNLTELCPFCTKIVQVTLATTPYNSLSYTDIEVKRYICVQGFYKQSLSKNHNFDQPFSMIL